MNRAKRRLGGIAIENAMCIAGIIVLAAAGFQFLSRSVNQDFAAVTNGIRSPLDSSAPDGEAKLLSPTEPMPENAATHSVSKLTEMAGGNSLGLILIACLACAACAISIRFRPKRNAKDGKSGAPLPIEAPNQAKEQRSRALQNVLTNRNRIRESMKANWQDVAQGHASVGDYMSTNVFSVEPELKSRLALAKLHANGFRRCMVTDRDGKLLGVVSKKDVSVDPERLVENVMTSKLRLATPEMDVHAALSVMLETQVSCLPVVDKGLLVGVITNSDLLMVLQCLLLEVGGEPRRAPHVKSRVPVRRQPVPS